MCIRDSHSGSRYDASFQIPLCLRFLCELPGTVVWKTALFIFVVSGDDALHEHMADHVGGREAADLDILHAVEHADGLLQAADLVARQVDLRDICLLYTSRCV